jgi:hypothetical protein
MNDHDHFTILDFTSSHDSTLWPFHSVSQWNVDLFPRVSFQHMVLMISRFCVSRFCEFHFISSKCFGSTKFWWILMAKQCASSSRSNGLKYFVSFWMNLDPRYYPNFEHLIWRISTAQSSILVPFSSFNFLRFTFERFKSLKLRNVSKCFSSQDLNR